MNNTITFFDEDNGAVIWEIAGAVDFHFFKTVSEITHVLRQNDNSIKQINCIKSMELLSDEILDFIKGEYFVKAKSSGLKFFAFVVPSNEEGRLSMEIANEGASQKWDMEIKYFNSRKEATDWLATK